MATNLIAEALLTVGLVLPAFNDFARKADLDLAVPLDERRVTWSKVFRLSPGVIVRVDGRHHFNWVGESAYTGRVSEYMDLHFATPHLMEKQKEMEALAAKPSKFGTNQALQIGEKLLQQLGWKKEAVGLGSPHVIQFAFVPTPDAPPRPLPLFIITWPATNLPSYIEDRTGLEMEISGLTGKMTRLSQLYIRNTSFDCRTVGAPKSAVPEKGK
jgi:hypothetical protein